MAIEFYKEKGEYGYLANYSPHGFWKNGIYYKTAEHYYQSEKFNDRKIKQRIIDAATPNEAAAIGRDRSLERRSYFRDMKVRIMYQGVLEKFRQNGDIRNKLIRTKDDDIKELTEKESYWGVGPELDGENNYGKILIKVRDAVKKELLDRFIFRSYGQKVYILGSRNPDCDSVFSALILTRILRSYGIDAVFAVRDEDFESKKIITDHLIEDYEVIKDYQDKEFILVDHNELDGIDKNQVIGAIDQHDITGEVEDVISINYASTGLLLYDLFKDEYDFKKEDKALVGLTVLSKTDFLTKPFPDFRDRELYVELGLNVDVSDYRERYCDNAYEVNSSSPKELVSKLTINEENCERVMLDVIRNGIDFLVSCDKIGKSCCVKFVNEYVGLFDGIGYSDSDSYVKYLAI